MKLNYLLIFVPIALILDWVGANPVLTFAAATLATIPLAGTMAEATESLAVYLGPSIGGLLNASLGNAPEIIIGLLALHKGLPDVVKASFTGSILGNLVLGLGLAMVFGGMKHGRQAFDKHQAGMSAGLLMLAGIGLIMPAMAQHVTPSHDVEVTTGTAIILLAVYGLSVVYLLFGAGSGKSEGATEAQSTGEPESAPKWSRNKSLAILTGITVVLAVVSEILTGAIEPASKSLGLTPVFAGVIALALAGNAAQLYNAVRFATKNQMDLALSITVGASTQVALFVAPLLVFVSRLFGANMDLVFTPFEVVAIVLSISVAGRLTTDGECNWMEGVLLVGVYLVYAVVFFALPA